MTIFRLLSILFFLLFFSIIKAEEKQEINNAIDIKTQIISTLIAELNVKEPRVSKSKKFFLTKLPDEALNYQKQILVKKICHETGADTLLDIQSVVTTNKIGVTELIVSGIPATYTNFRNLTEEEINYFIKGNRLPVGTVIILTNTSDPIQ